MNDENKPVEPDYEMDDYEVDVDQDNEEFIVDYNQDRSEAPLKEGLKDKILDLLKNNILYVILVVILIVPAVMQLKRMFASPPPKQELSYDVNFQAEEGANTGATVVPPLPTVDNNQPTAPVGNENAVATQPTTMAPNQLTNAEIEKEFAQPSAAPMTANNNLNNANNEDLMRALNQENVAQDEVLAKVTSLDDRLSKIEAMQSQISALTTGINTIQAAMTNQAELEKEVATLQNNLNSLGEGMAQLSKIVYQQGVTQQAQARNSTALASTPNAMGAAVQKEDFIVFATIPGRAWLRNRDGALVTIREGDMLPGYGRVTNINPIKGTVSLDSQIVFKEDNNG